MNSTTADSYIARFRKVLAFIDTHLDEDLPVERLAGVAAFSKYHFHRQFSELFGIGVHRYVQMLRLMIQGCRNKEARIARASSCTAS